MLDVEARFLIRSRAPGKGEVVGKCSACKADCFSRNSSFESGSCAQVWKILLAWLFIIIFFVSDLFYLAVVGRHLSYVIPQAPVDLAFGP